MKAWDSGRKLITLLAVAGGITALISYKKVEADSTVEIPVPENRQVTLTLRVPPKTEPMTREQMKEPLVKTRRIGKWYDNPAARIAPSDEVMKICRTFLRKGWVKTEAFKTVAANRSPEKYFVIGLLQHIIDNVIEVGQAGNFKRMSKRCNLTVSDVEDLRRMVARFEPELVLFGSHPKNLDKDLLVIQEGFKATRQQGMIKVLRVEGEDDGSTLIQLSVE